MAYSDSGGKFWQVDLTTRAGALGAAKQGALACFVLGGLLAVAFGLILVGGGLNTTENLSISLFGAAQAAVLVVAGLRLRIGKGAYWGMAAAVLTGIQLLDKIFAFSLGGALFGGVLFVGQVQGVRGALALKRARGFEDDDIAVFN